MNQFLFSEEDIKKFFFTPEVKKSYFDQKFTQSNILLRRELLTIILTGFMIFSVVLFNFFQKSSIQNSSVLAASATTLSPPPIVNATVFSNQKQASSGIPVRLKIPNINVDTTVESVGLTSNGAMDTPKGKDNVAWFELGSRPGNNGSAVIVGHYGIWKDGKETVFNDLSKLQQGDELYVEDDKGIIISFIVRESRNYDSNADTSDIFNSNDGKAHLNLITCNGNWNEASKSYPERLVVFTDKVI